jgi:hypothetical protein
MPAGIFLIWPALHLFYGVTEVHSHKVATPRRLTGIFTIIISVLLMGQPFGCEQGAFYWLFALMALGLVFVQLRIFQPALVQICTTVSLIFLVLAGIDFTGANI